MFNFSIFLKILKDFKKIKWSIFYAPIILLMLLTMMILPLPPILLDIFFTFNIVLSIMILLSSMFTKNTIDFISFPTILLFSTLLRLSLNIASTRIILTKGHTGFSSAGNVIESFGHFLLGNNFFAGIIIFIILIIINFIVITKGSGRIAEVGARFALDGMPGKQMAIDADLNSGSIEEKEAIKRRIKVYQEADFYGSMDGASKFVRGDAIAGILIMFINIVGGVLVGCIQHNMNFNTAIKTYTLLTIGDGLVAQIPALLISTSAGVMVTRISNEQNVSEQIVNQLFNNFKTVLFSSLVLFIVGLVPNMPHLVFLLASFMLYCFGSFLYVKKTHTEKLKNIKHYNIKKSFRDASWKDVKLEDTIKIELGENLYKSLNSIQKQDLLEKIKMIRKNFAKKIGFLPSVVYIRNNFALEKFEYRILIKGVEYYKGELFYNLFMIINNNTNVKFDFPYIKECIEPIYGIKAFWIEKKFEKKAKRLDCTIVDSNSILVANLNNILNKNLDELFGCYETQKLIEHINIKMPKLIEEIIPNIISLSTFNQILKNLLNENVYIRDMKTILESLIQNSYLTKDPNELTSIIRISLSKFICQEIFKNNYEVNIITLDKDLENAIEISCKNNRGIFEPELSNKLFKQTKLAIKNQIETNGFLVIVVDHSLRHILSKFLRQNFYNLYVLSFLEIPNNFTLKSTSIIGKM
ncbi:flagellar biosynthesis protein FlhA [Buchnera aphidicola (Ceratoglyphina bambusae)]|uniref:flagellar biosynthesis protein FlhA n=1 Tax=Buchnera aphidicola TaxID=9 RepID=UPI0031B83E00